MYLLYRSRHLFSWLPALIVAGCLLFASQQAALKIQPRYDETAIELALVEPEPAPEPQPQTPPDPQPEPPPPEPEPIPEPVVPAPEPIVEAKPVPKPQPKPKPKPVKEKAKPVEKPKATPAPAAPRALVSKPAAQPAPAAPVAPKVNAQAIENGYLLALRRELEQRKRYPSGRRGLARAPAGQRRSVAGGRSQRAGALFRHRQQSRQHAAEPRGDEQPAKHQFSEAVPERGVRRANNQKIYRNVQLSGALAQGLIV